MFLFPSIPHDKTSLMEEISLLHSGIGINFPSTSFTDTVFMQMESLSFNKLFITLVIYDVYKELKNNYFEKHIVYKS